MTSNNSIRLSFAMFAWGLSTLVVALGAWYDLKASVKTVLVELDASERRISVLEMKKDKVDFTQEDAADMRDEISAEIRQAVRRVQFPKSWAVPARRTPGRVVDRPRPYAQPPIYGR